MRAHIQSEVNSPELTSESPKTDAPKLNGPEFLKRLKETGEAAKQRYLARQAEKQRIETAKRDEIEIEELKLKILTSEDPAKLAEELGALNVKDQTTRTVLEQEWQELNREIEAEQASRGLFARIKRRLTGKNLNEKRLEILTAMLKSGPKAEAGKALSASPNVFERRAPGASVGMSGEAGLSNKRSGLSEEPHSGEAYLSDTELAFKRAEEQAEKDRQQNEDNTKMAA